MSMRGKIQERYWERLRCCGGAEETVLRAEREKKGEKFAYICIFPYLCTVFNKKGQDRLSFKYCR